MNDAWSPDPSVIVTAQQKAAKARADMLARFEAAIQAHTDAVARERDYRHGDALAGYASSTRADWAAEAQAFVAWRDGVWTYAHDEMAKVEAGERELPTIEDIIGELPVIEWPSAEVEASSYDTFEGDIEELSHV